MDYKPATYPGTFEYGQPGDPQAVLCSHPDFPNTLSEELEGVRTGLNPAWPHMTVQWVLARMVPTCHTIWDDFDPERMEKKDGVNCHVVFVRPGRAPEGAEKPVRLKIAI